MQLYATHATYGGVSTSLDVLVYYERHCHIKDFTHQYETMKDDKSL